MDPKVREQGRLRAQEEHERKMKMLQDELERLRLQALLDAEEITRTEDEEQRENLDVQRREAERLARELKEEEKMLKLKETLMNYDFQCRPLIRKEAFLDLQVDDIELIRIALIGPAGSGKTSFIGKNKVYSGRMRSALFHLSYCDTSSQVLDQDFQAFQLTVIVN